jgi:beta-lysine 5,6-aminomutase alpha subunit
MKRPATGGRGLEGVAEHEPDYYNPATDLLDAARPVEAAREEAA